ncbi:MAG: MFS transporter [Bacteroidota bacterium]|nr:MFS transporter [Bacteroidota bacterium]MDP4212952.1 MFS transporter [Bacteroidota bacterium]MDP4251800.1 MFS transporter [Bacteroidota bacterium]
MKSDKKTSLFSGLTRNTFLLALTSLFADISSEMLYPILPIFLTQNLKVGGSIVGIVEGVAETTQNIVQGFSGWLSDKWQKRKGIAVFGYVLAAISKPFIGMATGWPVVLGARFMDRLGSGTRSAPRDAMIAASADERNRGKAFGLEGVGDNLGAFIGPLIAVALLFLLEINIRSVFYLSIIPGGLAVLMILTVRERKVAFRSKAKIDLSYSQFSAGYRKYLLATALFGIGNSSNAFLILQTKDLGVSFKNTILLYAAFNLLAALISYPSGNISDKLGRKNILLVSFIIFLITYTGFAFTENLWLIGGLFCLYGLYQGIFRSVGKAMAADLVPPHLRASGIGWYSTIVGLSGLVASIVAGQLWDKVSHHAVFLYGAAFSIVGIISLIILIPGSRLKLSGPEKEE